MNIRLYKLFFILGAFLLSACVAGELPRTDVLPTREIISREYFDALEFLNLRPYSTFPFLWGNSRSVPLSMQVKDLPQKYTLTTFEAIISELTDYLGYSEKAIVFMQTKHKIFATFTGQTRDIREWKQADVDLGFALARFVLSGDSTFSTNGNGETAIQIPNDVEKKIFDREVLFYQDGKNYWIMVTREQEVEIIRLSANGERIVLYLTLYATTPGQDQDKLLFGLDEVEEINNYGGTDE